MNHLLQVQLLLSKEFSQVGGTPYLSDVPVSKPTQFAYSCLSRSAYTSQGPKPSGVRAVPATWAAHHPHRRLTIANIPRPPLHLEVALAAWAIDAATQWHAPPSPTSRHRQQTLCHLGVTLTTWATDAPPCALSQSPFKLLFTRYHTYD
jgi:hypothetical protein